MRLHRLATALALAMICSATATARAGIVFDTNSTARLTVTSQLLGGSEFLTASGPQHFTIDPVAGTANVTSAFVGHDLVLLGQTVSYNLYNTITTGVSSKNLSGTYNVSYSLLFELQVTSGALAGLTFETKQNSTFASANIATLPFPTGTVFADPGLDDSTNIYVKSSPTPQLPAGTLVGTTSGRTVTIDSIVPEPATWALGLLGAGLAGISAVRKGRWKPV